MFQKNYKYFNLRSVQKYLKTKEVKQKILNKQI